MDNNPFAKYAQQPQQDPIIARDPYKAPANARAERADARSEETTGLANELARIKIGEASTKTREEAAGRKARVGAYSQAAAKTFRLLNKIERIAVDAEDNGGWGETGTSGSVARAVLPRGTAGFDLRKNLDTMDANLAFDALAAMREASKTGGALGAITERELDLLRSSVANLDPDQGHGQFLENLREAGQQYLDKLRVVAPRAAASFEKQGKFKFITGGGKAPSTAHPPDIDAIMQKYR